MKKEAMLYEKIKGDSVRCFLCSHKCVIAESAYGLCGVRKNSNGTLYSYVYAEAIASQIDPIEKKPLYHFLPGSRSYSIATIGCNFRCGFCQNWQISQVSKRDSEMGFVELNPEEVVRQAKRSDCRSISYTYTEPTIFFEYAFDTAKIASQEGIYNNFVTNGYMSKEALDKLQPYLHAANVDLKSFKDSFYKKNCKARLQPVLDSISYMKQLKIWVEVTTLLIPGQNDSDKELNEIAEFISSVDKSMPWHISKFHPDYQFTALPATSLKSLKKAEEIGKTHGLRYVYLGNVHDGLNTYCHNCNELLIERSYITRGKNNLKSGACPSCGTKVDGVWE